ncbi:MAG: hypothetical protein AAF603_07915, partial [Pseudomonadota bacterium]
SFAFLRHGRQRMARLDTLFLPLMVIIITAPHFMWFLSQADIYKGTIEGTLKTEGLYGDRLWSGLGSLVVSTLSFFLPWALVIASLTFPWWRSRWSFLKEEAILLWVSGICLCMMVLVVLFTGASSVSERYFIPLLAPAYIALTSAFLGRAVQKRLPAWLWSCGGVAVLVMGLRLTATLFPGPPFCNECRQFTPYQALKAPIERIAPMGSILIVREENTGGNMVALFPRSPVRVFTSLHLTNPIKDEGRPCFFIWSEDTVGGVKLERQFTYAYNHPDTVMVTVEWSRPIGEQGQKETEWGITPITDESLYTQFCSRQG